MQKFRKDSITLRALEKRNLGDSPEANEVRSQLNNTMEQLNAHTEQVKNISKERYLVEGDIHSKNRAALAGVGMPGIAGLSYGYEGFKDQ